MTSSPHTSDQDPYTSGAGADATIALGQGGDLQTSDAQPQEYANEASFQAHDAYASPDTFPHGVEGGQADAGQAYAGQAGQPYPQGSYADQAYQGQAYAGQAGQAYAGQAGQAYQQPYVGQPYQQASAYQGAYPGAYAAPGVALKSKVAAGLLAILLGSLGIHNFYLGHTGRAVAQLLLSVLTLGLLAGLVWIWAIVEGILILSAQPGQAPWGVDANGYPLQS